MRVRARAAVLVTTAVMLGTGTAYAAELPRGPVTAQTVAAAQAEADSAAAASTAAAREAALAQVALDEATSAAQAAAAAAEANPTPENVAAAAAASAAQAAAQTDFNAKSAAAASAAAEATSASENASREAASFAKLSGGTATESATEIPETDIQPPSYEHSDNVTLVDHVRGVYSTSSAGKSCPAYNPTKCPGYSSLNFLHYENLGYDVMVANGTAGLAIWSLKDPAHPKWIGKVTTDDLAAILPDIPSGGTLTQFWEGENMTVDSRRKLVFMSRDSGSKGQIIIDVKDPWNPQVIAFNKNFQGHTSTCLNDCRFLWSVGGTQGAPSPAKSSPVSVTDVRDPLHPFVYPAPIASNLRRSGATGGSTHSVDVDFDGIVWVSGSAGVRGFYTEGLHTDPATGEERYATPFDPIPYAGGSIAGNDTAFMHNAYRFPNALGGHAAGDVMLVTNENNQTTCSRAGVFIIASLAGTYDATDNPTAATRMTRLAAYSTAGKPGEFHGTVGNTTVGDCSAHWFTVKGNIVALGNYEQGTRFLDISDPTNPQQVGYFRVPAAPATDDTPEVLSSDTSAAYWHGKYVYVSDYQRGIDIIKLDDSALRGKIEPKACWNSCADTQVVDPMTTSTEGTVGGSVSSTLSLSLTGAPSFGTFVPGTSRTYTTQTNATVTSTAGDAELAISDATGVAPGRLVNGSFSLPLGLQAQATSTNGTGAGFLSVTGSPRTLLGYGGPVTGDAVTLGFRQSIGANDALRTGTYSKTLTFTLSTTHP